jgi:hypothetical protein
MIDDRRKPAAPGPEHDENLAAVAAAWRRLPAEEPPDLVDRAVLNRARRDLETRRPRRLRWIGHFATAGVVVIAVSVWLLQDWGPAAPPGDGTLRLEPAADTAAPAAESFRSREAPATPLREEAPAAARRAAAPREKSGAAPAAMLQSAPAAADAVSAADEAAAPRDPEAWIEELLALQADGRTAELQAGLAAFRAAYPDHPLPPALAGR